MGTRPVSVAPPRYTAQQPTPSPRSGYCRVVLERSARAAQSQHLARTVGERVSQTSDLGSVRGWQQLLVGRAQRQQRHCFYVLNIVTVDGRCVCASTLLAPRATETSALLTPPPRCRYAQLRRYRNRYVRPTSSSTVCVKPLSVSSITSRSTTSRSTR